MDEDGGHASHTATAEEPDCYAGLAGLHTGLDLTAEQAHAIGLAEGLPRHHLQMSLLAENSALHPIRREQTGLRTFALNGYLEGWAEYAAGLCEPP